MIIGSHQKLKQIDSDPLFALGDFPIQGVKITIDQLVLWWMRP